MIANIVGFVSLENKHFSDQVKIRLISQLINGVSKVSQNLLNYSNDTIILTVRSFPPSPVEPIAFCLNLNKALLLAALKLTLIPALIKDGLSL